MLFGAVLWYCSLVPFQTFSQQEAYEALSRYKNLFFYHLDQYQCQYHHHHHYQYDHHHAVIAIAIIIIIIYT